MAIDTIKAAAIDTEIKVFQSAVNASASNDVSIWTAAKSDVQNGIVDVGNAPVIKQSERVENTQAEVESCKSNLSTAKANYDNVMNNPKSTTEQKAEAKKHYEIEKNNLEVLQNVHQIALNRLEKAKMYAKETTVTDRQTDILNQLSAGIEALNKTENKNNKQQEIGNSANAGKKTTFFAIT